MNTLNIPDELKALNQWVCWKDDKTPVSHKEPLKNGGSDATNPVNWGSFHEAIDCMERNPGTIKGIGIALNNVIACIDIDGIKDVNNLPPSIKQILDQFNSYAEVSPSGNGLHIYFLGCKHPDINWGCKKPFGDDGGHIEAYFTGRYMTVTGDMLPQYPIKLAPITNMIIAAAHIFRKEGCTKTSKADVTIDAEMEALDFSAFKLAAVVEAEPRLMHLLNRNSNVLSKNSNATPSEFDLGASNILVAASWDDNEIAGILYKNRLQRKEDVKRKDYYTRTIQKSRESFAISPKMATGIDEINAKLNLDIEKITVEGETVKSIYRVYFKDGNSDEIGDINAFTSQKYWNSQCKRRARDEIDMKKKEWKVFWSQLLMDVVITESVNDPETESVIDYIQRHIGSKNNIPSEDYEDDYDKAIRNNYPVSINGQSYISLAGLKQEMTLYGDNMSQKALTTAMKDLGLKSEVISYKTSLSQRRQARYWQIPKSICDIVTE